MDKIDVFFSVVVPAYNASKTIRRTLESIASQTYENYEVIIVDDHSEDFDCLKEVVDEYGRYLNVQLLKHELRKNGAAARNTGIFFARGKYIAFVDADDEWLPGKLQVYKEYIDKLPHPERIIFYGPVLLKDTVRPAFGIGEGEHVSEYLFLSGGFIQTSTICVSAACAKAILFDERFKRHQDYDFCLRAYSAGCTFFFIDKSLARYHIQGAVFKMEKESLSYSVWWLGEMKTYMSKMGKGGFHVFNLCGRAWLSKSYLCFLRYFLVGLVLMGPVGLYKARRKIAYISRNFHF